MHFKIIKTANMFGSKQIFAEELAKLTNTSILKVLPHAKVRYKADNGANEDQLSLIQNLLSQFTALDLDGVDCVICATALPYQSIPATCIFVCDLLGLSGIDCFDINLTCMSFLKAIQQAGLLLKNRISKKILIVSSDVPNSGGVVSNDFETSILFSDGAAAILLESADNNCSTNLGQFVFKAFPEGKDYCYIRGGTRYFHECNNKLSEFNMDGFRFIMHGKEVFRITQKYMPMVIQEILDKNRLTIDEIDWVVPHQGSNLGLSHLVRSLRIDSEKVINICLEVGNQIASSLPTALCLGIKDKKIKRGDKLLLIGSGAGITIGGGVIEY